jgi:hypothetical protein
MCTQKSHNIYCEGQFTTSRQKVKRVKNKRSFKEQRTIWTFKEQGEETELQRIESKKGRWRRCLLCYEEMERRGKGKKTIGNNTTCMISHNIFAMMMLPII